MNIIGRRKITWLLFLCSCKRMSLHHTPSVIHSLVGGKRWIYLCTERRILKEIVKPSQMQRSGDPQIGLLEKGVSPFVCHRLSLKWWGLSG